MSHYAVLVINTNGFDDVDAQLAPYDENIRTAPRSDGFVSDEDVARFREEYTVLAEGGDLSQEEVEVAKAMSDRELYDVYGDNWNGKRWAWNEAEGKFEAFTTYNPDSKWDWYQIGGRWAGRLKLKEGMAPLQPIGFSWGWDEAEKQKVRAENRCDQAYKAHVDWDGMRAAAREEGEKRWANMEKITEGLPLPTMTWTQCREKHNAAADGKDRDAVLAAARIEYNEQPWVKAINASDVEGLRFFMSDPVDVFCILRGGRDQYLKECEDECFATYAVLKDGVWISKGDMGWFGCSSESEEEARTWAASFYDSIIKPLPEKALLTVVDLHI